MVLSKKCSRIFFKKEERIYSISLNKNFQEPSDQTYRIFKNKHFEGPPDQISEFFKESVSRTSWIFEVGRYLLEAFPIDKVWERLPGNKYFFFLYFFLHAMTSVKKSEFLMIF